MFYNTTALAVLRQLTKGAIDFNRLIHGTMADLVVIGHKHHANFLASDPIHRYKWGS